MFNHPLTMCIKKAMCLRWHKLTGQLRIAIMKRQLFIYYRIPKADIAVGVRCAQQLMTMLLEQGLGRGELFQREEENKPYFTLMEVIQPSAGHAENMDEFTRLLAERVAICFANLPTLPARHIEVFVPCA